MFSKDPKIAGLCPASIPGLWAGVQQGSQDSEPVSSKDPRIAGQCPARIPGLWAGVQQGSQDCGPVSSKRYKIACATVDNSDQPVHQCSLIIVLDGYSVGIQGLNISS